MLKQFTPTHQALRARRWLLLAGWLWGTVAMAQAYTLSGSVAPVVGSEHRQRVALTGLPAGQYAYQLVVDGQLVAAPQRLMVNP